MAGERLYAYKSAPIESSDQTFTPSHRVVIPGDAVTTTTLPVIFKNTATDGCGTVAVYNVRLDRNDATANAPL